MLHLIANESAGSGAGAAALREIRAFLDGRGIPFRVDCTAKSGDAAALADAAWLSGDRELVCVGGDGTVFEIVNGLAGRFAALYFVPCGTGNDFVKMLGLPKGPAEALRAQLEGEKRAIDVGRLNEYYFLNVSGSGFDVEVLRQAARFKRLGGGLLPYLLGCFAALRRFRPLSVELTVDGEPARRRDVTIFSVGNGRYIGGGMLAVPHAEIGDGLFDLVVADGMGRLSVLRLLGKFISGRHTELPMVHERRAREVTVRCPGMVADIDGELVQMDEARYSILPGALEVRFPR